MENSSDKIEIIGSGRTDSGVHALNQVANFHIDVPMSEKEIMDYVNQYLPEDIAVTSIKVVSDRFHSRLNAIGKVYLYRVKYSEVPNVFNRKYVYEIPSQKLTTSLDLDKMRKAARFLEGTHDFKSFCTKKKMKKSTIRTIYRIDINIVDDEIHFLYHGNGFLYHMIRILTGTLIEVGLGKRQVEDMESILAAKSRECSGELLPGKGLTLVEVQYD